MDFCDCLKGHYARKLTPDESDKLKKDRVTISEFKQNKLEIEAKKNWDLFYKRNETRFFKDRHWTKREFEEIVNICDISPVKRRVLLEVGCGVGNFIFPLIQEGTDFYIHACDFSSRAIDFMKKNPLYNDQNCNAFVCDVSKEELIGFIEPDSVSVVTMIFVLSTIHPQKMLSVLENIFKVLTPGGVLLIRDYGLFDQAMLRFRPGHKLEDNFYVRQDGTRAFYFSEDVHPNDGRSSDYLDQLLTQAGYQTLANKYVTRETINYKENIRVPRIYIQGKFLKPQIKER